MMPSATIEALHQITATMQNEDFDIHTSSFITLYFISLATMFSLFGF